jgi:hypothetical protein
LREIGLRKWNAFKQRFSGRTMPTLAVTKNVDGSFGGMTRNYLPVLMEGGFDTGQEYDVTLGPLVGRGPKAALLGTSPKGGTSHVG